MNIKQLILLLFLLAINTDVMAYGSSGGKQACAAPVLNQFTPPHLTEVAPETGFSFVASASTAPETIQVTVKKQAVEVSIKKNNKGYLVTGKLPDTLKKTYARININASSSNHCQISKGWLLKITE